MGWREFYLLAAEHGLAGMTVPVDVSLGDAFQAHFDTPVTLIGTAYVLPVEHGLEDWSDTQLTDFVEGLVARTRQDAEAARTNLKPIFHSEDDLLSASVISAKDGQLQMLLSFGLVLWPDFDTSYDFEAQVVPPSLRPHLKDWTLLQPNTLYPAAEPLVATCRDLVKGRRPSMSRGD